MDSFNGIYVKDRTDINAASQASAGADSKFETVPIVDGCDQMFYTIKGERNKR